MAKNKDEVSVTTLVEHNSPKGIVKEGDKYVTSIVHANLLIESGFVKLTEDEV